MFLFMIECISLRRAVKNINNLCCGCSSMVEFQPSKLATWVRFPSPAPMLSKAFTPPYNLGGSFMNAPLTQLDRVTAF